tara:strand:+ start:611 stop:1132 length:522 start_codon:yes stop_codon:yes gene_type:complete
VSGSSSDNNKTRVVGAQRNPKMAERFDPMVDPVVGWLVVTSGVGKGTHRPIGNGQNTVGRGEDARIKLVYGAGYIAHEGATQAIDLSFESHYDGEISRIHFIILYDQESRRFYIQNAQNSTNLTYLKGSDAPLMVPTELKPFDRIRAGKTELMFVPLCHPGDDDRPGFDWKDT